MFHLDGHRRFQNSFGLVGPLDTDLIEVLLDRSGDVVVEVLDFVADLARNPFDRRNDSANSCFWGVGRFKELDVFVEVLELVPRWVEDGGLRDVERGRVPTHAVFVRHLKTEI